MKKIVCMLGCMAVTGAYLTAAEAPRGNPHRLPPIIIGEVPDERVDFVVSAGNPPTVEWCDFEGRLLTQAELGACEDAQQTRVTQDICAGRELELLLGLAEAYQTTCYREKIRPSLQGFYTLFFDHIFIRSSSSFPFNDDNKQKILASQKLRGAFYYCNAYNDLELAGDTRLSWALATGVALTTAILTKAALMYFSTDDV